MPGDVNALSPTIAPTGRTAASIHRRARQAPGSARYQARASGTTISAPDESPSHHVRQTVGTACQSMTSPERSETEPTVALTIAPAAIATTDRADAANAGERRATLDEAAQQKGSQNHLEHVPAGLAERWSRWGAPCSHSRGGRRSGRLASSASPRGTGRRCPRPRAARRSRPQGRRTPADNRSSPPRRYRPASATTPTRIAGAGRERPGRPTARPGSRARRSPRTSRPSAPVAGQVKQGRLDAPVHIGRLTEVKLGGSIPLICRSTARFRDVQLSRRWRRWPVVRRSEAQGFPAREQ